MQNFTVIPVPGPGAEDVVVVDSGPEEGCVYTGTEDGAIFRITPDGGIVAQVAHTGGRPLGLELAADGRLLVCDAHRGLLWVDPTDGTVESIAAEVAGVPMQFCNNAAIAADGTIWFSDSSTKYPIEKWKDDFVQNTRTGRLLRRDPDGTITTVLDGLAFANGVALAADESYVVVAETAARTVVRHWLTEERKGLRDKLCSDLPGYPDNIARGSDGLIWVTLASPLDPVVERLHRAPLRVRKLVTKIPDRFQPKPQQSVRVRAFDDAGELVHDLDIDPAAHGAAYHMVTGVREHAGRVWMGSLQESAVAVCDL
ncbi:SMP-30/gluconolactonase/LRE family protein [Nocardioides panacisoli]|uniref:SMP-30/gluconolactonase/LRE family protein n=1 Tax=Nocardioides panacisoli TaxID=627624 RepID=UPI001C6353ED|nr:SMP-30/gluconolactonase/LRE family protein [Nocardioides panacisoli]QYJ04846.1 SMP-30/gluconolactonase/LRE family protein [Nocardioides panacisoli]